MREIKRRVLFWYDNRQQERDKRSIVYLIKRFCWANRWWQDTSLSHFSFTGHVASDTGVNTWCKRWYNHHTLYWEMIYTLTNTNTRQLLLIRVKSKMSVYWLIQITMIIHKSSCNKFFMIYSLLIHLSLLLTLNVHYIFYSHLINWLEYKLNQCFDRVLDTQWVD